MITHVQTPQEVFFLPQQLLVPLFQRRYVWNEELQWSPLWQDILRVANKILANPGAKPDPHFLGAVVLQQQTRAPKMLSARTIIDGQQRLTTLQLLLDALHAQFVDSAADFAAARIESLVVNAPQFCAGSDASAPFKVLPTNRDRQAFQAVMGAKPPVNYEAIGRPGDLIVQAHRFFSAEAREWLRDGPEDVASRADALDRVVRDYLQMVVIDLSQDDNAQEIFETLNARGTPLSAADLIKNFVFQRLAESGADVEETYRQRWAEFETGFWETEVSVGRVRYPRSAVFLNHWLVAKTGEDILTREVFSRFKRFVVHDTPVAMPALLERIGAASKVYRDFVTAASATAGPLDRVGLFAYRTGVLESEVVKPLVVHLLDPDLAKIPEPQFQKAVACVESWMVRRMLVRATTKNYNQVVSELLAHLRTANDRQRVGDQVEGWLKGQTGSSRYWPDDDEVRAELADLPAYRRLSRGRLRMVLEAIEDDRRGFSGSKPGFVAERVPRGSHAIEHVMPRKWVTHWRSSPGFTGEIEREALVHTLGNLTLLTKRLNSTVSNARWRSKRSALKKHDTLLLTRDLLEHAGDQWVAEGIRERTHRLVDAILTIWPAPPGHRSGFAAPKRKASSHRKVSLADLLAAGDIQPGIPLFPRLKAFSGRIATVLDDGRVEVDGEQYDSPSDAAEAIIGVRRNGMWFFLVSQEPRRSLAAVKREYIERLAVDADDAEDDDSEEDEA